MVVLAWSPMRRFRSHGDGSFHREQFAAIGDHVVFEQGVLVWHPETISLGENVYIGHSAMLKGYYKSQMSIGDDSWIGQLVFLHSAGGLTIGDRVGIGPRVTIITSSHAEAGYDRAILDAPLELAETIIEDDADIGVASVIVPGVRIGRGAQVAAGAVVTRDVEPFSVVAGNPARLLRWRPE